MSRVINTDSPGKRRSQLMRTCAEIIRHLSQKRDLDEEARDMAATLVYCFRGIAQGIEDSAQAWEKRDYWVKAERFRAKWIWPAQAAANLEDIVRNDAWDLLPRLLADLLPEFSSIKIARLTRGSDIWDGAYERLLTEQSSQGEMT
jgi:hypothetical protein